jgi:hypothetical protein
MTTLDQLAAVGVHLDPEHNEPTTTTVSIRDVAQLRSLLDLGLDEAGRQQHLDALMGTDAPAGGDPVRTVNAQVIGNEQLDDPRRAVTEQLFPIRAQVVAAAGPVTVDGRYDLSTPDGRMSIVTFTDVTLNPGGYFYCAATPLSFTCDTLTRNGDSGAEGDLLIVGRTAAIPGTPPTPGAAGQAQNGNQGQCSAAGVAGPGGDGGSPGDTGSPGTPGGRGGGGTASQPATIRINTTLTTSRLVIFTQSGPGGTGGDGGQGGPGQQGGDGGNGVTCGCTGNAGGPGGPGGQGGPGGRAGDGGDGVDAAGNIVLYLPTTADIPKVIQVAQPAPPGQAGNPGHGGSGGAGGNASTGGKNNPGGSAGPTGIPGSSGTTGIPGSLTGRPATITTLVAT